MKKTVFDEKYKTLTPKQKQAVDTIEGPVMVIAGPGTGKTTILTLRIANILLKTDTPPSGILAITFTEAGVKAMKMKLREIIGARADEVRIHTFHGFAASVISEFADHFVHIAGSRQITDIDAEAIIREILQDKKFLTLRPFGRPDFYIQPILGAIRDAKKDAITPEMMKDFAKAEMERVKNDEDSISTRGATKGELKADAKKRIEKCEKTILSSDVYSLYEEKKRKEKLIDFDDLIFELSLALSRDELLRQLLQEKFLYILVDEHQDTNDAQNAIIKTLADFFENPNVFIVGDEKQAIYRFQGASVSNFLRFSDTWKDITTINLEDNFRSHQNILDAVFGMIENNYEEGQYENLRMELKAGGSHAKGKHAAVEIVDAETIEGGEAHLIEELRHIIQNEPDATVAIISRRNRDIERIISLSEGAGIPIAAERSINIWAHPIGIAFFSLIEFLHDPSKTDALSRIIITGLWNFTFSDSTDAIAKIRSGRTDEVVSKIGELSYLQKLALDDTPISFLIHACERSGLAAILLRDPSYAEVWRAILSLSESLVGSQNITDPHALIESLLSYKASAAEKSVKVPVGVSDAQIKAMTAHGSKGLEFDYVFIPYATEESWNTRAFAEYFVLPITSEEVEGDDVRDNRRLFYVAMTRARKKVSITVPQSDASGKILSSLRFVSELPPDSLSHVIPKGSANLIPSRKSSSKLSSKVVDYTKTILLEKGLSATALNNFLSCPSEFIYQSILKIPEAPAPSAEKGNAMHKAFSRIWNDSDKSTKNIETIIRETVNEHIEGTYLRPFEKEALIHDLSEKAPAVAKSLAPHFGQEGTIFSENWSEFVFEGEVSGTSIKIPIHGKLDVIIDTGKDVYVFDYKTRARMSENEIRGLTKAEDSGNYFRQLVFYKFLLENDHRFKGKNIIPSLIFVTPDEKGNCAIVTLSITPQDEMKLKEEINSLLEAVWSGKITEEFCDDKGCEWCQLKRLHRE